MGRGRKETATHIEYEVWLTFDYFGPVRVTKQQPDLSRNERAMFMRVKLPKQLFTIPLLHANVTVEDQGAPKLDVIAIGEAVKLATGLDIDVRIAAPEPENNSSQSS
jgi:hypothetical protein